MTTGPYTDIDFVLSSSEGRGDFIGISGSGLDKSAIGVFTCESGSENFLSKSAGTILNVYNGPYQYPSWQQVRNLYNPIVRKLVRESTLSLADVSVPTTSYSGQIASKNSTISCFKEPVVSDDSKPLRHVLEVQPNINEPTITTSSFTYTYDNNLTSFTNSAIRNRLGIQPDNKGSIYKNISQLYLDLSEINLNTNPVRKFVQLDYSQILYPAALNAFLNDTRTRTNYAEVAGTGSDGYDRTFGHQRTFFKESQIRNFGTASNSQGYFGQAASSLDVSYTSSQGMWDDGTFDSTVFYSDETSALRSNTNSWSGFNRRNGDYVFKFGSEGAPKTVPERYFQWKNKVKNHSTLGKVEISFTVIRGTISGLGMEQPDAAYSEELLIQFRTATGSWNNFPAPGVIAYGDCSNTTFTSITASVDLDDVAPDQTAEIRVAMINFSDFSTDNYAIQQVALTAQDHISEKDFLNFNPMATDGIRSFPDSSSYRQYDGELMGDSDESMFGTSPSPSMAFVEQTHLANSTGSLAVLTGYVERLTEQISGKSPWYDTYEKYAEELRPVRKDMSIIPEFRMSEFIEYYLIDKGGNFRARNDKFLLLDGAPTTSSAISYDSSFDENFISKYSESSNLRGFYEVGKEHEDIANISRIELSCQGMKKLLPYNGFYPANRTIQLGNLLSQSLSPHIGDSTTGAKTAQALQGLLKPLVSPGILYNSIKSGIGVDYPIYTGTVPGVIEGDANSPFDFKLADGPNYRLPFEALLNLKGTLPEGKGNDVSLVSSFATFQNDVDLEDLFKYKFTWTGEKSPLFELGMHNFLAETVDFFLEDGKLSSYQSKPDDQWDEFDQQKTYYMDVVLRDNIEMNKFIEYGAAKGVTNFSKFTDSDPVTADQFGYSVSMVSGSPGEGLYALVGAPSKTVVAESGTSYAEAGCAYLFQNKLAGKGWQQLQKITAETLGGEYLGSQAEAFYQSAGARFGHSVAIDSGSDGLYMLIGSPWHPNPVNDVEEGLCFLYHTSSTTPWAFSIFRAESKSGTANDDMWGYSVAINIGPDGLYMLVGQPGYQVLVGEGRAEIINSPSRPTGSAIAPVVDNAWVETLYRDTLTGSGTPGNGFGGAVAMVSGSDGIYVTVGQLSGIQKLYLVHSASVGGFVGREIYDKPAGPVYFGHDLSMVSGAGGTEGIYILAGAPDYEPGGGGDGEAFLYHTSLGATHDTTRLDLTGSGYDSHFGYSVSVDSGSSGIYMLVGAPSASYHADEGIAWAFHSSSGALRGSQKLFTNNNSSYAQMGYTVSLISSSNFLYSLIGAPGEELNVTNIGACYLYGGALVGDLSYDLSYSEVSYSYKQHGKLFGMALENAYDPAYCAYTPPCFYGEAIARISYSPTLGGMKTLDHIFANAQVENILNVKDDRMAIFDGQPNYITTLQEKYKMPVSASINMFGKFSEPSVTYDSDGNPISVGQDSFNKPAWVISTRFESPVLDMENSKYDELYTAYDPYISGTFDWEPAVVENLTTTGMAGTDGAFIEDTALDVSGNKIYWTGQVVTPNGFIGSADLDTGLNVKLDTVSGLNRPWGIAIDSGAEKIYWTEMYQSLAGGQRIARSNLDGTEEETLVNNTGAEPATDPRGIALDVANNMMYWVDNIADGGDGKIFRTCMDGTGSCAVETLVSTDAGYKYLRDIALDLPKSMMYATDFSSNLIKVSMDGGTPVSFGSTVGMITGLAVDSINKKIYYVDTNGSTVNRIIRTDLDGNYEAVIASSALIYAYPAGLSLDIRGLQNGEMYWAWRGGQIQKANADVQLRKNPRTMWTSYGDVPQGTKGLYFEIKESFPGALNQNSPDVGSLIQACKFTIPEQGKSKVGKLRETKEISEAIIAIPYFESDVKQEQIIDAEGARGTVDLTLSLAMGSVGDKRFVRIPRWNFDRQKQNIESGGKAVITAQGEEIATTTVSDMIEAMKKYVIPPNLDFVKYPDIDPFVMYIFEFKHVLQQKELTDIWQGVMPASAMKMEQDEVIISHDIGPFDFFGNVLEKNRKILGNMKFLIFKVKRRARHNYYALTKDSTDDERFNFTFQGDPTATAVGLGGSYNWPYDFFSLVEKAKIEAKFILKNKPPPVIISEGEE